VVGEGGERPYYFEADACVAAAGLGMLVVGPVRWLVWVVFGKAIVAIIVGGTMR
jgi:hypothetical protein